MIPACRPRSCGTPDQPPRSDVGAASGCGTSVAVSGWLAWRCTVLGGKAILECIDDAERGLHPELVSALGADQEIGQGDGVSVGEDLSRGTMSSRASAEDTGGIRSRSRRGSGPPRSSCAPPLLSQPNGRAVLVIVADGDDRVARSSSVDRADARVDRTSESGWSR